MVVMDLVRFAVMMTIPVAYAFGALSFAQMLIVSAVVAAAKIAFASAGGSFLKSLVRPDDLLLANSRFESTLWSSTAIGPPLGGAAIGIFGPVTTIVADAVSYLLSAFGIAAIGGHEPPPTAALGGRGALPVTAVGGSGTLPVPAVSGSGTLPVTAVSGSGTLPVMAVGGRGAPPARGKKRMSSAALLDGWRHILADPTLRGLYLSNVLVSGLIMATEPLLAVIMLGQLKFPPWQYGLAFAVPCVGGLIGSRLARRVVARFGERRVIRVGGWLRCCWLIGLAFVRPGLPGLLIVMLVEFLIIVNMSLYSPVVATYRLNHTPPERSARMLSAWSISSSLSIAICTALGGVLADLTTPRTALVAAGALILAAPLFLPAMRDERTLVSAS
jgi:predicted MFS family arabinose efflux permease